MRQLYAGKDQNPSGYKPVTQEEAQNLNQQGYGIFWTVNEFDGPRKKIHLKRLKSWYVEMDKEEKPMQMSRIEIAPIPPTMIIESKRGYQLYWDCLDNKASLENYKTILEGLQAFFNGDENAKDVTRLLRAPGYLHLKNPSDPFKVEIIGLREGKNSDGLMTYSYPTEESEKVKYEREKIVVDGADFWSRAMSIDCEMALKRLSGTSVVNGEVYSFRINHSGTLNIFANDRPTSAWIDSNKKIGSMSKGGPGIAQWLHWFGYSYAQVKAIILEMFPEVR